MHLHILPKTAVSERQPGRNVTTQTDRYNDVQGDKPLISLVIRVDQTQAANAGMAGANQQVAHALPRISENRIPQ